MIVRYDIVTLGITTLAFILSASIVVFVLYDDATKGAKRTPKRPRPAQSPRKVTTPNKPVPRNPLPNPPPPHNPPDTIPKPKKWDIEDLAYLTPGSCGLTNSSNYCFSNAALQTILAQRVLVEYFVPEALPPGTPRINVPPRGDNPTNVERELEKVFRIVYNPEERAEMIETNHQIPLKEALISAQTTRGNGIQFEPDSFRKVMFEDPLKKRKENMGEGQHDTQEFRRYLFAELNRELNKYYGIPIVKLLDCTNGADSTCELVPQDKTHCSAVRQHEDDPEIIAIIPPLKVPVQQNKMEVELRKKEEDIVQNQLVFRDATIFEKMNDTRPFELVDLLNQFTEPNCIARPCEECKKSHAIQKPVFVRAENQKIITVNIARGDTISINLMDGKTQSVTIRLPVKVRASPVLGIKYEEVPPKRVNDNIETISCDAVRKKFTNQFYGFDTEADAKEVDAVYRLVSVTIHITFGKLGGHYTAATRNPIDGQWYHYNDEYVKPITLATDTEAERTQKLLAYVGSDDVRSQIYSCSYERV